MTPDMARFIELVLSQTADADSRELDHWALRARLNLLRRRAIHLERGADLRDVHPSRGVSVVLEDGDDYGPVNTRLPETED